MKHQTNCFPALLAHINLCYSRHFQYISTESESRHRALHNFNHKEHFLPFTIFKWNTFYLLLGNHRQVIVFSKPWNMYCLKAWKKKHTEIKVIRSKGHTRKSILGTQNVCCFKHSALLSHWLKSLYVYLTYHVKQFSK